MIDDWGSRRVTGSPGRDERWGVWGAISGPLAPDRGAPRLRRGASERWGVWGAISGPPTSADEAAREHAGPELERGAPAGRLPGHPRRAGLAGPRGRRGGQRIARRQRRRHRAPPAE